MGVHPPQNGGVGYDLWPHLSKVVCMLLVHSFWPRGAQRLCLAGGAGGGGGGLGALNSNLAQPRSLSGLDESWRSFWMLAGRVWRGLLNLDAVAGCCLLACFLHGGPSCNSQAEIIQTRDTFPGQSAIIRQSLAKTGCWMAKFED